MNEDEIDKLDQYMYDVAERRFNPNNTSIESKLVYLEAVEDVLSYLRGEPYTLEEDKLALTKDARYPQAQAKTYRDIDGYLWIEIEGEGDYLKLVDETSLLSLPRAEIQRLYGPLELALEIN